MSSAPSHGPSSAPSAKPKGYLGMSRITRLALIGAPLAAWLSASVSGILPGNGCGNPDPSPISSYVPTEREDITSIPGRMDANQAGLEKECNGADRAALRIAHELRKKMLEDPAVKTALGGRADELVTPQNYKCPHLEAYAGSAERNADAWVINDGTFGYSRTYFDGTGNEGKCKRASTELALEACQAFGGCAEGRGYVQVGSGIALPENICTAKTTAYQNCMEGHY